ncbi:MAG: DUF1592 domain-containing protein [Aureliella sp.]
MFVLATLSNLNTMLHPAITRFVTILCAVALTSPNFCSAALFDGESETQITAEKFITAYCADCHTEESAEGERNFDSFRLPFEDVQDLLTADEIIDQITLGAMPPEGAEQPSDAERIAAVNELRAGIAAARDKLKSTGGRTVMRRLSNREYEVTLAALMNRRVDTLGLTADFPKDATSKHVDTIGDALITSGFLLDQYFQSASRLVEMRLGKPEVEPKTWHFTENFKQYEELAGAHLSVLKNKFLCLYEQPNTDTRQGGYGHIEDFLEGVPVSGLYDIEVYVQAMHRDTHYDPKIFRIDFSEPFQLAVVTGDVTKGHIHYPQAIEPVLASAIVPDAAPEWIGFQVWLEAGQTPRFIFPNGPYESRASVIATNKRYKDEFKNPKEGVSRSTLLREGALPHIRIGEIKIHGPVPEPGGSKEELAVFGPSGFHAEQALAQLSAFASKAYRRPLAVADRTRIKALYSKRIADGASPRQAALDCVKLILCSPSFLYLSEITPEDESKLRPFDLASRLSYALWASPPDELLSAAAKSGKLAQTKTLEKQIERMINDKRSAQFVGGFLDSWLNLRDIGNLPPPRKAAWEYYAQNLPASMKQETRLFFASLLDNNGPVTDLLSADYTFVDKRLADLYDLPEEDTLRLADGFQRVSLAGNKRRGGVLAMASVLTVSANGVDTSPVTRGVWVSENVLGVTPPPPPDEVPALEADVRGALTIREKLAKHSADSTCVVCHRKIDPLGFALESFDPIGRWRDKYPKTRGKTPPIDSTGKFPTGETYEDFSGFKNLLVANHKDRFARHLIEMLLTYSTGRHMERVDQYEIDDILKAVQKNNYGLRTMVTLVLTSEIFRSR